MPRLLTVAGRRPHPYPQLGDRRLPCPRKLVWQHLIDQLTGPAGARCSVVADTLPGGTERSERSERSERPEQAEQAERAEWCRLGPAGQYELAEATARQVAEDLGLLAGQDQRIPLPLSDEPEGATR